MKDQYWEAAEYLRGTNDYPYEMMPLLFALIKSTKGNTSEAHKLIQEGRSEYKLKNKFVEERENRIKYSPARSVSKSPDTHVPSNRKDGKKYSKRKTLSMASIVQPEGAFLRIGSDLKSLPNNNSENPNLVFEKPISDRNFESYGDEVLNRHQQLHRRSISPNVSFSEMTVISQDRINHQNVVNHSNYSENARQKLNGKAFRIDNILNSSFSTLSAPLNLSADKKATTFPQKYFSKKLLSKI